MTAQWDRDPTAKRPAKAKARVSVEREGPRARQTSADAHSSRAENLARYRAGIRSIRVGSP